MILKLTIAVTSILIVSIIVVAVSNVLKYQSPRVAVGELRQTYNQKVLLTYYVHSAKNKTNKTVLLIPSLGRSASDFNELVTALVASGYRTIAIEPRGMLDKTGLDDESITLFDLADDVNTVVSADSKKEQATKAKLFIIGHAFGNRVARAYAERYSDKVQGVALIVAGGKVKTPPRIIKALTRSFWIFMPEWWRKNEIHLAFFATGNIIPDYWVYGWNIRTSRVQVSATKNLSVHEWWYAGKSVPLLVVQGQQDKIAPPEHTGDLLQKELGDRVRVKTIGNAGHAILPEAPEMVSKAVLDFLDDLSEK